MFGVSAAWELARRGHSVVLVDQGTIPHPLAASTDISKVIRMEYGADQFYMELVESARDGWLEWNERWLSEGNDPLYHETGVLMITQRPMSENGFEFESWRTLEKRGHAPERIDPSTLADRFPAWNPEIFVDGFYHPKGGFTESGQVVARLAQWAEVEGVVIKSGWRVRELIEKEGRVMGVRSTDGREITADWVLVTGGAWTATLLAWLSGSIRATGHPVFHLVPRSPELFSAPRFPVFTADIARTGYYGFPVNRDGVVKIANHGVGQRVDPDGPREVTAGHREALREFLASALPGLSDARVVYTRLCLYADTQDQELWIDRDPNRDGLVVAGGGSGHGFKFAPILGPLVADALEGNSHPWLERFRWREDLRLARGREAARYHGETED